MMKIEQRLAVWLCALCCMQSAPAWAEEAQNAGSAAQTDERPALSSHSQCHPYFGKRRFSKKNKKRSNDQQAALESNTKEGKL